MRNDSKKYRESIESKNQDSDAEAVASNSDSESEQSDWESSDDEVAGSPAKRRKHYPKSGKSKAVYAAILERFINSQERPISNLLPEKEFDIVEMVPPVEPEQSSNNNKDVDHLKKSNKRKCIIDEPAETIADDESLSLNTLNEQASGLDTERGEKPTDLFKQAALDYVGLRLSKENGLIIFCSYFSAVFKIHGISNPLKLIEKTNQYSVLLPDSFTNYAQIADQLNLFANNGLGLQSKPFYVVSNDYKTRIFVSKEHELELAKRAYLLTLFGSLYNYLPPLALNHLVRAKSTGHYFHLYFNEAHKKELISQYEENQINYYEDEQQFPGCILLDKPNYDRIKQIQLKTFMIHDKLTPLVLDELIELYGILDISSTKLKGVKRSLESIGTQQRQSNTPSENAANILSTGFFTDKGRRRSALTDELMTAVADQIQLDATTRHSLIAAWFSPLLTHEKKNFPLIMKIYSDYYQVRIPAFININNVKPFALALNQATSKTLGMSRNIFTINDKNKIILSKSDMIELSNRIELASIFDLASTYKTPIILNRLIYHKQSTRLFHLNLRSYKAVEKIFSASTISLVTYNEFPKCYFLDEKNYRKYKALALEQIESVIKLPHLKIDYVRNLMNIAAPYLNLNYKIPLNGLEEKLLKHFGDEVAGNPIIGYISKV